MANYDLFLDEVKDKMNNNQSYIIGSIPNVRYIINLINLIIKKDWKYEESGILDKTHLRFFTEKSLRRLFNQKNYKIITFKYINNINNLEGNIILSALKITRGCLINIISIIFGGDIKYLQFAFCIKK